MTNYNSFSDKIQRILDQSPAIRVYIRLGIINVRALAKYLIEERKIDADLDAVISAIRRYKIEPSETIFEKALKVLMNYVSISTKSSLVIIATIKDKEIQDLLPKFFSLIHYAQGETLRIVEADESIKIFIDEKNLEKILEYFPGKKIQYIHKHLAEININLTEDVKHTPGVVALISNEFAMNGVNVVEVLSCFPEELWFVEEKDLLKAYKVISQLCQQKRIKMT